MYGRTWVRVMAACIAGLGIPLIVHFHGSDASVCCILEQHAGTYPAMFRPAAAIVAGSTSDAGEP